VGVSQYKLDYSTDGGNSWFSVQDWTSGNPLTYAWTVPGILSNQYRVMVSCQDVSGNTTSDISDNDFSISEAPPQVSVISPNGGEIIECGSIYDITWSATANAGITQYKIEYSLDGGSSWMPPIQDWANGNPETFAWSVPCSSSTQCLVRISCRDQALNVGFDNSDAVFTVNLQPQGCNYVLGDVNNNGLANGIDAIYSVGFFKGGDAPPISCDCPPHGMLYAAGDVNGSCVFNGIDITYFVSYLKGGADMIPCPDCRPLSVSSHPRTYKILPNSR
jgi:hypothetical protein